MFWCQIRCPGQSHAQSHATLGSVCLSWGRGRRGSTFPRAVSGRSEDKKLGRGGKEAGVDWRRSSKRVVEGRGGEVARPGSDNGSHVN
jgi:hypothetical protein